MLKHGITYALVFFLGAVACTNNKPLSVKAAPVSFDSSDFKTPEVISSTKDAFRCLATIPSVDATFDTSGNILGGNKTMAHLHAYLGAEPIGASVVSIAGSIDEGFSAIDAIPTPLLNGTDIQLELKKIGTHTLTFKIANGEAKASCQANVVLGKAPQPEAPGAPTVTLTTLSQTKSINYGGEITVSWVGTNVDSCVLKKNGLLTEFTGIQNQHTFVNLTDPKINFTVDCLPTVSATMDITVGSPPIVNFSANGAPGPVEAKPFDVLKLTWNGQGVGKCRLVRDRDNFALFENVSVDTLCSGSWNYEVTSKDSGSFTLEGLDSHGARLTAKSITLNVVVPAPQQPPPVVQPDNPAPVETNAPVQPPVVVVPVAPLAPNITLGADRTQIGYQEQVNLYWKVTNASNCTLKQEEKDVYNGVDVPIWSSPNLPAGHSNFTLNCLNSNGSQTVNASKSIQILVEQPNTHIIFVSSQTYNAGLGGLSGADAKCDKIGQASNLRPGRKWKAVMSFSGSHAKDRIRLTGDVLNTKGEVVSSAADFFDGSKNWRNAVRYSEAGIETNGYVWTASNENGKFKAGDCGDWNNGKNSGNARVGIATHTNQSRFDNADHKCNVLNHVYCISQ